MYLVLRNYNHLNMLFKAVIVVAVIVFTTTYAISVYHH